MEEHTFDPEFVKEFEEFGLKHPMFLPKLEDKLVLELFYHLGICHGAEMCTDIMLENIVKETQS